MLIKQKQDPDCMGGRDFRGRNDAPKEGQTARLPEAEREGLNPSFVWGKTCGAQNKKEKLFIHRQ